MAIDISSTFEEVIKEIRGKANLAGENTFTGGQTITGAKDGYSLNASGYVKGSWLQAPSTGHAASGTGKICVLDVSGWIYYRTPAEVLSEMGGAKASDIPAAVTESTVSGWGFTKNKGTVTSVKANGTTFNPDTTGIVDLGDLGGSSGSIGNWVTIGESNFTAEPNSVYAIKVDGYSGDTAILSTRTALTTKVSFFNVTSSDVTITHYITGNNGKFTKIRVATIESGNVKVVELKPVSYKDIYYIKLK